VREDEAEIKPVGHDGVLVVGIGTGVWLVALVVLVSRQGDLRADGHLWWIACAATGFGLGLLGVGYCVRRRNRLALRKASTRPVPPGVG